MAAMLVLIGSAVNQADPAPEAFDSYEKIRALLAEDKLEGLTKEAERLAKFTTQAAGEAKSELKPRFRAAAEAAGKLRESDTLAKARRVFGNLSREFVEILKIEPVLARGRYVYECPMVKEGYPRWVQVEKKISNPYMGKAMSQCGVAVELD